MKFCKQIKFVLNITYCICELCLYLPGNMQKGTVPYYNVKSYLVYNIFGICTIYTFKLRQFAKKLACTRVTAYIFQHDDFM